MTTPPTSPATADDLALSPSAWNAVRHAAFAGRLTLLLAAFITLLAAWINRPLESTFVGVIVTVMALGLGALAGLSVVTGVRRQYDAGAALVALLLAGGEAVQAFGLVGADVGLGVKEFYVLPMFAWILLLGGGLALFATLLPGPVATATREIPNPFAVTPGGGPSGTGGGPSGAGTTGGDAPPQQDRAPAARPPSLFAPTEDRSAPDEETTAVAEVEAPAVADAEIPAVAEVETPTAPDESPSPAEPDEPTVVSSAVAAPDPEERPASSSRRPQEPARSAPDPQPGWYPSPDGTTAQWWDGARWTGERRPLSDFEDDAGRRDR